MTRLDIIRGTIVASIITCLASIASAQPLTTQQFASSSTSCSHVIEQMTRHGVNNSVNQQGRSLLQGDFCFGGISVPAEDWGDLQIVQVTRLPDDPNCGPNLSVIVLNQSTRVVRDFHVAAVAVFDQIHPFSPNCTTKIGELAPGAAMEVHLQLPLSALSMGNRDGMILGYQKLIVALDCYDQLLESDEANNLRAFRADELTIVATTVQETTTIENAPTEAPSNATLPSSSANNASFDPMAPETITNDSLRTAIQQLESVQPQQTTTAGSPQQQL